MIGLICVVHGGPIGGLVGWLISRAIAAHHYHALTEQRCAQGWVDDHTPALLVPYRDAYNTHDIKALALTFEPAARDAALHGTLSHHKCTHVAFTQCDGTVCSYTVNIDGAILEGQAQFDIGPNGLIERETVLHEAQVK